MESTVNVHLCSAQHGLGTGPDPAEFTPHTHIISHPIQLNIRTCAYNLLVHVPRGFFLSAFSIKIWRLFSYLHILFAVLCPYCQLLFDRHTDISFSLCGQKHYRRTEVSASSYKSMAALVMHRNSSVGKDNYGPRLATTRYSPVPVSLRSSSLLYRRFFLQAENRMHMNPTIVSVYCEVKNVWIFNSSVRKCLHITVPSHRVAFWRCLIYYFFT